ncbi:hypothetical protein BGX29_007477 [Mortierella sp. GBA35]|nr:hypothetical protein BGX29_007477 [Mortierella sp. GBA35]
MPHQQGQDPPAHRPYIAALQVPKKEPKRRPKQNPNNGGKITYSHNYRCLMRLAKKRTWAGTSTLTAFGSSSNPAFVPSPLTSETVSETASVIPATPPSAMASQIFGTQHSTFILNYLRSFNTPRISEFTGLWNKYLVNLRSEHTITLRNQRAALASNLSYLSITSAFKNIGFSGLQLEPFIDLGSEYSVKLGNNLINLRSNLTGL